MGRSLALESRQGRCRGWSRREHISLRNENEWEKSRTGKHRPLLWLGLIWDRHGNLGQASCHRVNWRLLCRLQLTSKKKQQFTGVARSVFDSPLSQRATHTRTRTGRRRRCLSKPPHFTLMVGPTAEGSFAIEHPRYAHSLRSHWWHEAGPEPSASAARRLAPNRLRAPVASPPHARVSKIPVRNRDQRRNRRREALSEMRRSG